MCCPMMSAWDLHKAWPEAEFKVRPRPFILSDMFLIAWGCGLGYQYGFSLHGVAVWVINMVCFRIFVIL